MPCTKHFQSPDYKFLRKSGMACSCICIEIGPAPVVLYDRNAITASSAITLAEHERESLAGHASLSLRNTRKHKAPHTHTQKTTTFPDNDENAMTKMTWALYRFVFHHFANQLQINLRPSIRPSSASSSLSLSGRTDEKRGGVVGMRHRRFALASVRPDDDGGVSSQWQRCDGALVLVGFVSAQYRFVLFIILFIVGFMSGCASPTTSTTI